MKEYRQFPSYNGLDRVIMFMGVPLIPAILIFLLLLLVSLVAQKILGIIGLAFMMLGLPIFLFLKQICETDDRALNMLALEMLFRFKRRYYQEFGNTLTYLQTNYLRNGKYIQQVLKQTRISN